MKRFQFGFVLFLGLALVASGCSKKEDQASLSTTAGFDSLSATDELSQLPPASGATAQQPVEALPIETSPMTQMAPMVDSAVSQATSALTYQQKIQTALKNAGLYTGAVDGKIGPASRKAIETFQKNNGLTVDGKVGPKTWAALETYLNNAQGISAPSSASE